MIFLESPVFAGLYMQNRLEKYMTRNGTNPPNEIEDTIFSCFLHG